MVRAGHTGSSDQLFFSRNVRTPGIPTLMVRKEVNCKTIAEKIMLMRADRRLKHVERSFKIGDRVRYFDDRAKRWKNFGTVLDFGTHGASKIQSCMSLNLDYVKMTKHIERIALN